jgi:flagellar basal body-associated protein FliL
MTEDQSKNKKILKTLLLLFIVIYIIPLTIVSLVYIIEIKPHVDSEINTFTESFKNVTDPQTKIRKIANFTAKGYYQTYPLLPRVPCRFT